MIPLSREVLGLLARLRRGPQRLTACLLAGKSDQSVFRVFKGEQDALFVLRQGRLRARIGGSDTRPDTAQVKGCPKDVGTDGNRYKLFAADRVGHRRRFVFATGCEVPQGLAVPFIHGHKIPAWITVKDQPTCRRQQSRVSLTLGVADLRPFPNHVAGLDVEGPNVLLARFFMGRFFLPTARRKLHDAFLECHRVE